MAKEKLSDRLIKGIKINHGASVLSDNLNLFDIDNSDFITTEIPILNVALSGRVDGGLPFGVTMFAGPSKHFKTSYGLILAKAFQDKFPEGIVLYLDSEFGGTQYLDKFGIDRERVVHVPVTNIEELKFNVMSMLDEVTKDDKLFILCDSLGNLASKKEVEDALEGKSVADMSRAKQMKSFFRMVTPIINLKKIYTYFIQHTYQSQSFIPTDVVAGGTGAYYSSDTIVIVGRSQEKDKEGLTGFNFKLKIEKSRFVKEKSSFDIIVTFEGGVNKFSGLAEVALECGIIDSDKITELPRNPKGYRFKDSYTTETDSPSDKDFWSKVIQESDLNDVLYKAYKTV